MTSLERNRVFSMDDIEGLKTDILTLMNTAIEVSSAYNDALTELNGLFDRVPAEARDVSLLCHLGTALSDYVFPIIMVLS